jgi:hypothetical protein
VNSRLLSINQLSELTGKDRRTIKTKLTGVQAEPGAKGAHLYDPRDALPALYAAESTKDTEKQLGQESLLLERAKRQKLEIEVGRLRGELLPIDEIAKAVERQYSYVRAQIRSIPSKLAKPLSLMQDPYEIHARLSEAVDECLIELTADQNYEQRSTELQSARQAADTDSDVLADSESET